VIRTATVLAVAYAIGFAVLLIPLALLGLFFAPRDSVGGVVSGFVVLALLVLVVYPLLIWIFTAAALLIYNAAAKLTGGIEVDVERLQPPPAPFGTAQGLYQDWPQPGGGWPSR
jgi:hypothetical protein